MRGPLAFGVFLLATAFAESGCRREELSRADSAPETELADESTIERPPALPVAHGTSREPKTRVTDGIPVEEDYEEEAAKLITPATLEAEIAKLDAEIHPK